MEGLVWGPKEQAAVVSNLDDPSDNKVTKETWLDTQEMETLEYLSCAESHHKISNESVFGLSRTVAHHHSPSIRLCQFAAVWEGHLMRPYVITSIRKPGAGKVEFSCLFWALT